ncbi:hypothetical protein EON83_03820 [bacterium]|nr:MAG: hypothetical protein EON83_03820 [bacterium]
MSSKSSLRPRFCVASPLHLAAVISIFIGPAAFAADTAIEVGSKQMGVNVMKNAMPKLPAFPVLTPKSGFVRGYVKDTSGKPLAGAKLGIRASATGGFYSGAQTTSDTRGYYEIKVPWGSAHFYSAAYTIDYAGGRASLSLHPADGEAKSFPSGKGAIENWVLLPYGVADRDGASEKPNYTSDYYGGAINVDYHTTDRPPLEGAEDDYLPEGAEIELTLAPVGKLIDGSMGQPFVILRHVGNSSWENFNVNNLPIGVYRLSAKLTYQGKTWPLRMEEIGRRASLGFGLEPKDSSQQSTLFFRPLSAKSETTLPQRGNWDTVEIRLKK